MRRRARKTCWERTKTAAADGPCPNWAGRSKTEASGAHCTARVPRGPPCCTLLLLQPSPHSFDNGIQASDPLPEFRALLALVGQLDAPQGRPGIDYKRSSILVEEDTLRVLHNVGVLHHLIHLFGHLIFKVRQALVDHGLNCWSRKPV